MRSTSLLLAAAIPFVLCAQQPLPSASFGNNGAVLVPNSLQQAENRVNVAFESANGNIICVGVHQPSNFAFGSIRSFLPNGAVNTSFANNGHYLTPDSLGPMCFESAVQRPDGRILAVNYMCTAPFGFSMVQLLPNGTPDPDFGDHGYARYECDLFTRAYAIVLLPDGSCIVGGDIDNSPYVVHVEANGDLDLSFGNVSTAFVMPEGEPWTVRDIIYMPTGYLVVGGPALTSPSTRSFVAAVDMNGASVPWFGDAEGHRIIELLDAQRMERLTDLSLRNDGRIIVTGDWRPGTVQETFVLCLGSDGSTDMAFGNEGTMNVPLVAAGMADRFGLEPLNMPNNAIMLAGAQGGASSADTKLVLAKVTADGQLDAGFGEGGMFHYRRNNYVHHESYASMFLADGRLLVTSLLTNNSQVKAGLTLFDLQELSTSVPGPGPTSAGLVVYPNPASDQVTLMDEDLGNADRIILFDPLGRTVMEKRMGTAVGTACTLALPSDISDGQYQLCVRSATSMKRTTLRIAH